MQSRSTKSLRSMQSGATLVMALIVLVLIMMIGIAAVNTSNTQFKIAANIQFEDAAFNNAELAATTAESWLSTGANYKNTDFFTTQTTPGLLQATATSTPLSMAWNSTDSIRVNDNSRYTVQLLSINSSTSGSNLAIGRPVVGACEKVNTYLITGYGTSTRGAKKFIQSYYSVASC